VREPATPLRARPFDLELELNLRIAVAIS
jgi:hypothetical protein